MTSHKLRLMTFLITSSLLLCAPEAEAGVLEFPDEANAKLARHKAKARRMKSAQGSEAGRSGGTGSADCGSVDIGNVQTNGRGSPREVTVIVTGDVLNANNNCR